MANKRPKMDTLEELLAYLDANKGYEFPFVQECWDKAVAKAEENLQCQVPQKTVISVDKFGNETKTVNRGQSLVVNPVSWYFRFLNLPQFKKVAKQLQVDMGVEEAQVELADKVIIGEDKSKIKPKVKPKVKDDEDEYEVEQDYSNEVTSWIELFEEPLERKFLKDRYMSYMSENEINNGADRASLKGLLSIEVELYRIDLARAKGKKVDIKNEKELRNLFESTLQSLKWTKKQNSGNDINKQNKFTMWQDRMMKLGEFVPDEHKYEKDEIDFLLETIIESQREMLS